MPTLKQITVDAELLPMEVGVISILTGAYAQFTGRLEGLVGGPRGKDFVEFKGGVSEPLPYHLAVDFARERGLHVEKRHAYVEVEPTQITPYVGPLGDVEAAVGKKLHSASAVTPGDISMGKNAPPESGLLQPIRKPGERISRESALQEAAAPEPTATPATQPLAASLPPEVPQPPPVTIPVQPAGAGGGGGVNPERVEALKARALDSGIVAMTNAGDEPIDVDEYESYVLDAEPVPFASIRVPAEVFNRTAADLAPLALTAMTLVTSGEARTILVKGVRISVVGQRDAVEAADDSTTRTPLNDHAKAALGMDDEPEAPENAPEPADEADAADEPDADGRDGEPDAPASAPWDEEEAEGEAEPDEPTEGATAFDRAIDGKVVETSDLTDYSDRTRVLGSARDDDEFDWVEWLEENHGGKKGKKEVEAAFEALMDLRRARDEMKAEKGL